MKSILRLVKENKLFRISILTGIATPLLYIVNRFFLKNLFDWSFIQHYFHDVLAGMLIVSIVNTMALLGNQRRLLQIHLFRILFFTLVCGLFWEYVTPLYLTYSVSDPLDIAAYMFGGVVYWGIIRVRRVK